MAAAPYLTEGMEAATELDDRGPCKDSRIGGLSVRNTEVEYRTYSSEYLAKYGIHTESICTLELRLGNVSTSPSTTYLVRST